MRRRRTWMWSQMFVEQTTVQAAALTTTAATTTTPQHQLKQCGSVKLCKARRTAQTQKTGCPQAQAWGRARATGKASMARARARAETKAGGQTSQGPPAQKQQKEHEGQRQGQRTTATTTAAAHDQTAQLQFQPQQRAQQCKQTVGSQQSAPVKQLDPAHARQMGMAAASAAAAASSLASLSKRSSARQSRRKERMAQWKRQRHQRQMVMPRLCALLLKFMKGATLLDWEHFASIDKYAEHVMISNADKKEVTSAEDTTWPIIWLLGRFNKKHIWCPRRLPRIENIARDIYTLEQK
mmetsp:Transcript_51625/g.159971  ORF Transcript_51625/g.159971 Transcript_51625/m.159971 type:complete len:296 (+) Transcript_51625:834-1721(+)